MSGPSAPHKALWFIGLTAGILGLIGHYTSVDILSEHNYELLLAGFIALAVGTTFKGT